ncbi:hypothetical protein D3C71_1307990 [compost metagenome]
MPGIFSWQQATGKGIIKRRRMFTQPPKNGFGSNNKSILTVTFATSCIAQPIVGSYSLPTPQDSAAVRAKTREALLTFLVPGMVQRHERRALANFTHLYSSCALSRAR